MTSGQRNPTIAPASVRPGDVLFFAPPVENGDFEDFAQLAAYAQGAPWHHVAIAGPDEDGAPTVVGFGQTGDPDGDGGNWHPTVEICPWTSTAGYAITALRPPRRADDVAARAVAATGHTYALEGLLAFAAATQARMLVAGPTRERLLDFAAGAEIEGRKASDGHTCVTAVVAVLEEAGFLLEFAEPPPPDASRTLPGDEVIECVDELYGRLRRGSTKLGVTAADDGDDLLTDEQVAGGWDLPVIQAPGLIGSTSAYMRLLSTVIRHRFDDAPTSEQLVSLGQLSRRNGDPVTGWRVGPPMLRTALLEAGFTEVG